MSDPKLTLDRERREGLYELVRSHLGAIGDFWLVFERNSDYAAAERMGLEFAADFRLLQDLGWADHDPRERYVLTMPAHEMTGVLLRLQAAAVGFLIEVGREAEARRKEEEKDRAFELGYEACTTLLRDLSGAGRP